MNLRPIRKLDDIEREEILNAILVMEGSVTRAAEALGMHRNTLTLRLLKYDCHPLTIRRIRKAQGKLAL